jgi:hypothetical protein
MVQNWKTDVALCLRSSLGSDEQLVNRIVALFAAGFNPDTHLDIVFLTVEQQQAIARVCGASYDRR